MISEDSSYDYFNEKLKYSNVPSRVSLSVIIPTFNEAKNISLCLERVVAACPDAEILVVDGGSDDTEAIVGSIARKYPLIRYIPNRPDLGKGHAIRVGIENATKQ